MLDSYLTSLSIPLLEESELEDLLTYLIQIHQVDLTGYKRSTLMRRILVRMQQVRVERYQGYLECLQQQPNEVTHLLNTIYINYTYFFRDRPVWEELAHQIIPQVIANKSPDEPIRVWSAGCATGEETYSLVMLLIETLGVEQFRQRVKIYGTDVDLDAIRQACEGRYGTYKTECIPPDLQEQYFERRDEFYYWQHDFHDSIHFQCHNLIQDPPLSQIDLLICRNVLMYFTSEAQLQTLINFYFSLEKHGFLLLGKAENLITRLQLSLFTPVHRQNRIFTKVQGAYESSPLLSCLSLKHVDRTSIKKG